MNLINTLRKVWEDIPMWRRAFLVSFAADLGDLDAIGQRLYYAPTEIGNILSLFFGETIARRIEGMMREQLLLWIQILFAEKSGDRELIDKNTQQLYENVDRMAAYLAEINPYWDEEIWKKILHDYYSTGLLESVAYLAGRYEDEITLYESMESQALNIADYMAYGINRYFTGQ